MNGKIYLLIKEIEEDIANVMEKNHVSYVFCFNKKYQRKIIYLEFLTIVIE